MTTSPTPIPGRVLLVDRLPAGLEIENPRLVDSGDIKTLDWLKTTFRPEHTEFRDDRFVAAFNLWDAPNSQSSSGNSDNEEADDDSDSSDDSSANDTDDDGTDDSDSAEAAEAPKAAPGEKEPAATATVAYIVRAVTPGSFVHPAATIEDMYRPERYARSAAGTLVVKTK